MDAAIIGATGSCGRQVAAQLIERGSLAESATLHLIGHAGGRHESELWGLRADLRDAFADRAPMIEVGTDVAQTNAGLVIMMAGATVTRETSDRAVLAATNRKIFAEATAGLARLSNNTTVIVQSNPVELALQMLSEAVPRHCILGAAAWSDSLRFRRELAADLSVARPMVHAQMWGQHGDHLVPLWSTIEVPGISDQRLADVIGLARQNRSLADLPAEIIAARTRALSLIESGDVVDSYQFIQGQPADIRAAIKPFFTHFTAGHTTELATAHAVVDLAEMVLGGHRRAIPAQVLLDGEHWGIHGVAAVGVLTGPTGWSQVITEDIADDERAALSQAAKAISVANSLQ